MSTVTLPLLLRPPLRMYMVDGAAGFEGQAVAAAATSQLTRSAPLPLRLKGPSAMTLPPRKVRFALVLMPELPQLMYQLPLGTMMSPFGLHEYSDVQAV